LAKLQAALINVVLPYFRPDATPQNIVLALTRS